MGLRRRVIIGDVQGCARELDDLLDAFAYSPTCHELWFAGDLVNRGPDSLAVLRRVRELGANSVLGNHDLALLSSAAGTRRLREGDTLAALLDAPDRDELLGWLRGRPLVAAWPDLVLVHAGLHPEWARPEDLLRDLERAIGEGSTDFDDPRLAFVTRARTCEPDGSLGASKQSRPWFDYYRGRRTVVFGHWAARGLVRLGRVRGIDTGCVWGGRVDGVLSRRRP